MADRRRATAVIPFEVPEWVPNGIKDEARIRYNLVSNPVSPHGVALLKRLITAPRMKNVWTELTKKHRVGSKSGDRFFHSKPLEAPLIGKMTEVEHQLICMRILFMDVFTYANLCISGDGSPQTQVITQKRNAFLEAKKRLHSDAWFLRTAGKIKNRSANRVYFAKLATRLDKAATAYGEAAALLNAHYFNDDEIIAIWFSTKTSKRMLDLFGSPMYGTVATIASVVLQREIKDSHIREWCRGPMSLS